MLAVFCDLPDFHEQQEGKWDEKQQKKDGVGVEEVDFSLVIADFQIVPVYFLRAVGRSNLDGVARNHHEVAVFSVLAQEVTSEWLVSESYEGFTDECEGLVSDTLLRMLYYFLIDFVDFGLDFPLLALLGL